MRVLHIVKIEGIGGAEQHLLTLLPELRRRGVDARILALDAGGDAQRFYDALEERAVPCARVQCGLDISPRLAASVTRAVRRERPALLHTHMVHGDVYGSLAAKLLRLPFVSSRHNDDRYLLGPFRHVDRMLMRGVRRLIAISEAVAAFLIRAGLPASRVTTIHYGLDDVPAAPSELKPAEAGIADGQTLVLAIGRLIEQKDHATLLRAFARVHAEHPQTRLAILGWGPLESQTRALAQELGIGEALTLPGRVEPRDWLLRADVFAHSSAWEGFGLVLLEAMLAGLPVVATAVSAVPEIVTPDAGILVPPRDVDRLADALERLVADAALREQLGAGGRARARAEFSVARMADRTCVVYEEALA
jgi:glycosyltransferase involved in cell wall biosynthesis